MEQMFVEKSKQYNAMAAWDYVRECVSDTNIVEALLYCWGAWDMSKYADWMLEEFELTYSGEEYTALNGYDKLAIAESAWDYVRECVSDTAIVDALLYCWGTDDMFTYAAWMLEEFGLDCDED